MLAVTEQLYYNVPCYPTVKTEVAVASGSPMCSGGLHVL
jgi:hypothetical protein